MEARDAQSPPGYWVPVGTRSCISRMCYDGGYPNGTVPEPRRRGGGRQAVKNITSAHNVRCGSIEDGERTAPVGQRKRHSTIFHLAEDNADTLAE